MGHCIHIFTDHVTLPGAKCLIYSLHQHHLPEQLPVILSSTDETCLADPFVRKYAIHRRLIDGKEYEGISVPRKHWGMAAFFKGFEGFRSFGFDRNIVMDADLLCLGSLNPLFRKSQFSLRAARDIADRMRTHLKIDFDEFNSGMMVIDKSLQGDQTVRTLIHRAKTQPNYDKGDQGVIQLWAYEERIALEYLGYEWNMVRKVALQHLQADVTSRGNPSVVRGCRLLHFTGKKPWLHSIAKSRTLDEVWHSMERARCQTPEFRDSPVTRPGDCTEDQSITDSR